MRTLLRGFASAGMSRSEFDRYRKGRPYKVLRRKVITQASGKNRGIDDTDESGHSALSSDGNKLLLCSAFRPVQHVRMVAEAARAQGQSVSSVADAFVSAGEDWPNAYRYVPQRPRHSMLCVVVFWSNRRQCLVFQVYYGMLFGLPLAVTSFNKWLKFCEALCRRLLRTMVSWYFDDATVQDWKSCAGSGQLGIGQLMIELGSPFADEKRQPSAPVGDFLGLQHDLSSAGSTGEVSLWVRDRLEEKILDMIHTAQTEERLSPGTASKLFGCANFCEQGNFGKIGRGGLQSRTGSTSTRVP